MSLLQTSRPNSDQLFETLTNHLPGGVNSPVRSFPGLNCTPLIAERGEGAEVIDPDGNRFIDHCSSWGALILGHAHPEVLSGVEKRMRQGTSFGLTTEIEGRLAAKIQEHMPSMELLRFVSSGTEATMSAVRLARGFTGRNRFVKFNGHYHGHADPFLVAAGSGVAHLQESSSAGVPPEMVQYTHSLPFNDEAALRQLFSEKGSEIACVILEPIAGNMGCVPTTRSFMVLLQELCQAHGALLIFDEVMTGFRVGLGGAQELYGVKPDLTTLGKVIGGGFPAAAFGGRREVMEALAPLGPVYQAGTLSGNPVAMEAGFQTLCHLEKPGFYEELDRKAAAMVEGLSLSDCVLQRVGSMVTLFFGRQQVSSMEDAQQQDQERFKRFFLHCFENGVYLPPSCFEAWFLSAALSDEQISRSRAVFEAFEG